MEAGYENRMKAFNCWVPERDTESSHPRSKSFVDSNEYKEEGSDQVSEVKNEREDKTQGNSESKSKGKTVASNQSRPPTTFGSLLVSGNSKRARYGTSDRHETECASIPKLGLKTNDSVIADASLASEALEITLSPLDETTIMEESSKQFVISAPHSTFMHSTYNSLLIEKLKWLHQEEVKVLKEALAEIESRAKAKEEELRKEIRHQQRLLKFYRDNSFRMCIWAARWGYRRGLIDGGMSEEEASSRELTVEDAIKMCSDLSEQFAAVDLEAERRANQDDDDDDDYDDEDDDDDDYGDEDDDEDDEDGSVEDGEEGTDYGEED